MKVVACIVQIATGEERVVDDEGWGTHGWSDEETRDVAAFQWFQNNNSCDCNRDLYFHRHTDPGYDHDHDECSDACDDGCSHAAACGFEKRYRVPWIEVNGERIVNTEER